MCACVCVRVRVYVYVCVCLIASRQQVLIKHASDRLLLSFTEKEGDPTASVINKKSQMHDIQHLTKFKDRAELIFKDEPLQGLL